MPSGVDSLAGAVIAVYNRSTERVFVDGEWVNPGQRVGTVVTDAQGIAESANDWLPFGTYEAREISAPPGYILNADWRFNFSIRENGVVVVAPEDNLLVQDPIRWGVNLLKIDREIDTNVAQGDATLAGAVIEVRNISGVPVRRLDGTVVANNAVFDTITTNAQGRAISDRYFLPMGTFEFREITPPRGYLLNSEWMHVEQRVSQPAAFHGVQLSRSSFTQGGHRGMCIQPGIPAQLTYLTASH